MDKKTCDTCKANSVCDHSKYGFETCGNHIPLDTVEVIRCWTCYFYEKGKCLLHSDETQNYVFEAPPNFFCRDGEPKTQKPEDRRK